VEFSVAFPALPGCTSQGETREEALSMIREAIEVYIESLVAHGGPIPRPVEIERSPSPRDTPAPCHHATPSGPELGAAAGSSTGSRGPSHLPAPRSLPPVVVPMRSRNLFCQVALNQIVNAPGLNRAKFLRLL
jgi:antitoxin HicB